VQHIKLICVGKLKESFYAAAAGEYQKRLSAFCRIDVEEIPEARLPENPSRAEIDAALKTEADAILARLPKASAVIALCIEGVELDSRELAARLEKLAAAGTSRLAFVIGGSNGLHGDVKDRAVLKLSMSRMTFPHHLARIMLLEQLYRSYMILSGGKYHK
jgi:23S rRNA (pseudouridine1915-N3)-methyltransferase